MRLSSIIASRHRSGSESRDLEFTVDASISTTLTINLEASSSYSGTISWGDGSADTALSGFPTSSSISHTFTSSNIFQVKISGAAVPHVRFENQTNIISLQGMGDIGLLLSVNMFKACTGMASVKTGSYITSIDDFTFFQCSGMTSAIIGSGVTYIGGDAFYGCSSLSSISCLAMSAPGLGYYPFDGVSATTIQVPIGATGYGTTYGGLTVNYVL